MGGGRRLSAAEWQPTRRRRDSKYIGGSASIISWSTSNCRPERKDKSFSHMHMACAPASLLEAACRHYGARRMADLPGFSRSPNRPYIGKLIRYVVNRFVPDGQALEEDGLPKRRPS